MSEQKYMEDAQGRQAPAEPVKEIDRLRDQTVREVMRKTIAVRGALSEFKKSVWSGIQELLSISASRHNVTLGGKKGNITITSFDGRCKLTAAVNGTPQFNEKPQTAKALIDNCIKRRSDGSRPEIKTLADDAFYADKTGNINKDRVPGLRRLKIEDREWQEAVQAISGSIQAVPGKTRIRFYQRNESGGYDQIPLDAASV